MAPSWPAQPVRAVVLGALLNDVPGRGAGRGGGRRRVSGAGDGSWGCRAGARGGDAGVRGRHRNRWGDPRRRRRRASCGGGSASSGSRRSPTGPRGRRGTAAPGRRDAAELRRPLTSPAGPLIMDPAVLAFALVAGAVAAFNPCGFALLPAYLGLLVAGEPGGAVRSPRGALRRRHDRRIRGGVRAGRGGAGTAGRLAPAVPAGRHAGGGSRADGAGRLAAGRPLVGTRGRRARLGPDGGGGRRSATACRSRWPRCPARSRRSWPPWPGRCGAGEPLGVAGALVAYALGMGDRGAAALALAVATARTVTALRRVGPLVSRAVGCCW